MNAYTIFRYNVRQSWQVELFYHLITQLSWRQSGLCINNYMDLLLKTTWETTKEKMKEKKLKKRKMENRELEATP